MQTSLSTVLSQISPQVASQADHQLRVSKLSDGRATRTQIKRLTSDERVEEIARMLGGIDITAKAREHAVEMLRSPAAQPKSAAGKNAGNARGRAARDRQ